MIQVGSRVKVADNSGAKEVECLKVVGGYRRRYARVGDVITVSVKSAIPHSPVKKGDIMKAVMVRTKKEIKRKDGTCLRFSDNACAVLDREKQEFKGTRVFGPIAREVRRKGFFKIASLAPEVL